MAVSPKLPRINIRFDRLVAQIGGIEEDFLTDHCCPTKSKEIYHQAEPPINKILCFAWEQKIGYKRFHVSVRAQGEGSS
jgi:hypothetical protein